MVNKGNHPQMAAKFRLVKYYNLPNIYIYDKVTQSYILWVGGIMWDHVRSCWRTINSFWVHSLFCWLPWDEWDFFIHRCAPFCGVQRMPIDSCSLELQQSPSCLSWSGFKALCRPSAVGHKQILHDTHDTLRMLTHVDKKDFMVGVPSFGDQLIYMARRAIRCILAFSIFWW